jgi:predicted nucleic acid-binding protein
VDILVDTNVLLRRAEKSHPSNVNATNAVITLVAKGQNLCVLPQNIIEFWSVATRPIQQNGLGWSAIDADLEISRLEAIFTVLPDAVSIYREWRRIVLDNTVLGKKVHDARIVAAMRVHGISKLLTLNIKDFRRFTDIELIDPTSFLASDITDE